ncbi:S-methyl-5'-thioinosine phosphorylase [Methylophaga sulfidovorans]|uniref:Probable S-methyl-5'-thioinosine phosphorylase n=1 Tax=Methylophaga sulfidovorans TaxID=45496 RepID=A0A1I3V2M7_9GAMM|nr:S-methyl-5'-thioinosine phosphorylase [Methylophaga sulfidovorans]SFJ88616.1 methylthioadenosine phosphorylase [Methylophaga sulfidovorans]
MRLLGIIGGSGLTQYPGLDITEQKHVETPYGEPSAAIKIGTLNGKKVVFLPRHGDRHSIPPHRINYRANIHALKAIGVTDILAVAAVGGITDKFTPGVLSVPDQIIDYTHSREQSFFSEQFRADNHIDFTWPYDDELRETLLKAAADAGLSALDGATYAAVQGPRLETAAEIRRLARDGCDLVGMTGMPEACLAREAELPYATLAVVANWAAGITNNVLTMDEIQQTLAEGIDDVKTIIANVIKQL